MTVFAVATLGVLAVSLPIFGNRALIVRSGSMQPSIDVGDLVVVRPRTEPYAMGDVIAYRQSAQDKERIVTHRIVAVEEREGKTQYVTQGDANPSRDGELVTAEAIIGRQILTVPGIGKLLAFAKTRAGLFLAIIVPSLLVLILEIRTMVKEVRRRRTSAPANEASTLISSSPLSPRSHLLPLLAFVALSLALPSTFAFFSDTGASANNVFSAAASFGTDHLVISEVQIQGGNANQDFVELYNPTDSAVDLSGWKIRVRNSSGTESSLVLIPSGKSIPAHGFFLWSNDQGSFETDIGADVSNGNNLSQNNSVALRKPDDTTVDQVGWGTSPSGQFVEGTILPDAPGSNNSWERKAKGTSTSATMGSGGADEFKGNGFDGNNNLTDFVLRTTSQPQNSGSATETP